MIQLGRRFDLKALSTIVAIGLMGSQGSFASICVPPDLDTAYKHANSVFVGRLTSASVSEDFSAQGEAVLDITLKGSPPKKLIISTNIWPLTYCGPDLTIGKPYLIFLVDRKPLLVWANDPDTLRWIEKKWQATTSK